MSAHASRPWRAWRSDPQMPQRNTSRRTWPAPGVAAGPSMTSKAACLQMTDLMGSRSALLQLRCVGQRSTTAGHLVVRTLVAERAAHLPALVGEPACHLRGVRLGPELLALSGERELPVLDGHSERVGRDAKRMSVAAFHDDCRA